MLKETDPEGRKSDRPQDSEFPKQALLENASAEMTEVVELIVG